MFPHGTAVPQHGAELRKTVRYLPERQKLPDLLHPRFPHQPRCRPQPLRASAGRQSAMQRLCRLRTVPSKVEIVSRYCSCGLHNLSISQPVAIGKATLGKAPLTAQSAHITQNFNFAGCISNQGLHIPHHRCSWTRIENVTTGDMAERAGGCRRVRLGSSSWAWVRLGVLPVTHGEARNHGWFYGILMEFRLSVAAGGRDLNPAPFAGVGCRFRCHLVIFGGLGGAG